MSLLLWALPAHAAFLDASWIAPTTDATGAPLTDLASFKVYYGTTSSPCPGSTFVTVQAPSPSPGPNQTVSVTLTGLTANTQYFAAVTAVDTLGAESVCSPVASATAHSSIGVTPGGTVSFGSVNVGAFADQTFTVQNTGATALSGTATVSSPFTIQSGGSFNLGAGATASVTVRFTPTVGAVVNANVTFTGGGDSVQRTVTGTGVGANNPAPTLTSLSPSSASAGGAAFTLTASGTGFVSGSTLQWNGVTKTTTVVSSTQVTASISAADIATGASIPVTVTTPAPGGATSSAVTFSVSNPSPSISSLSPASTTAGGPAFTLTVNGSGFVSTSKVRLDGSDRTTTFVSATRLTAAITAADIATARSVAITVTTPNPGGGNSSAQPFQISNGNPAPTITSLSPSTTMAGGPTFTITVNGTGFVNGSTVRWNGESRTTTFVSATQLTAAIPAAGIATAGSNSVTVNTPTPGGGTSSAATFNVQNPGPTLTGLSPSSATVGGPAFTLTVTGTNFVSTSSVRWNNAARTTTFVSATQLTAAITAADIASASTASITVVNPSPGGGTSSPRDFPVNGGGPTIGSLSPASGTVGGAAFTLTVNGTNFTNGASVRWNGAARSTTFVSATQLTASIPASDLTSAATAQITVLIGSTASGAQSFAVNNPAPTLSSLSPSSTTTGSAGLTLTVTGTSFVSGSKVRWNGAERTTTYVSATQLTAAITAADLAATGTASVTVNTATPGGGTSGAQTFSVNNPVPALSGLIPAGATAGTPAFTLTVNGSNFVTGSVVRWNGSNRTTQYISPTQLLAAITAADVGTQGTAQVTVLSPTPGGGTTAPLAFGITQGSTVNNGLVLYWALNSGSGTTAVDSSDNGNTGTLLNGPAWVSGRSSQGLAFDGVDDYVQTAHSTMLNAYPITVSAWIKTTSTTGTSGIVSKTMAGLGSGWALYMNNGGVCGTYYRDLNNRIDDGSGCPLRVTGYANNQWHLVTLVVDATGGRMYVDGVSRSTLGWTGVAGATASTQPVQAGRYPGAPAPEFFPGTIDEVRIYGRALGASEAMELYTGFGSAPDITPPVLSAIAVTGITATSAAVTWQSNEPSDTQVQYGTTAQYGSSTALQATLVTTHVQQLTGLTPATTYHLRVLSRDFAGNLTMSNNTTFRTADPAAAAAAAAPAAKKDKNDGFFDVLFGWLF